VNHAVLAVPSLADAIRSAAGLSADDVQAARSVQTSFIPGGELGIDAVRVLVEAVKYRPAFGHLHLVIVDRPAGLSAGAMNALTKILEEPPDHVRFLLAGELPAALARFAPATAPKEQPMPQPVQKPSIGRIVLYQRHGSPNGQHKSEPSPAIVTAVHDNAISEVPLVDLCVFNPNGMYFNPRTEFDPDARPGTWRWPPRV
jgi:hypothetical protein